jgi:hypothetical protein
MAELPSRHQHPVRDHGMEVRMPVSEAAERLDRDHQPRTGPAFPESRRPGHPHSVVRGAREEAKQASLALKEAAENPWDREYNMPVGHRRQDSGQELLGQERRPPGLAARAEVVGLAGERQKVLTPAPGTADPGESVLQAPALQKSRDRARHYGAQVSITGLEPLLVFPQEALENRGGVMLLPGVFSRARTLQTRGMDSMLTGERRQGLPALDQGLEHGLRFLSAPVPPAHNRFQLSSGISCRHPAPPCAG